MRRVLLYVLGLFLILLGVYCLYMRLRVGYSVQPDLLQDYSAAKELLQGRSIYSSWNDHPPFNAIMILPFSFLPFRVVFRIWGLLTIVGFLFSIWMVISELKLNLHAEHICVLTGMALCWYPLQAHVALGQLSIVVSLCLIGSWSLLRRGNEGFAGFFIGLACLIKLFPGLILALMLFQKRWRAFVIGMGTLLIGSISILLLIGHADMLKYVMEIAPADAKLYAFYPLNVSLFGVWHRLFTQNGWFSPLTNAPGLASALVAGSVVFVLGILYVHLRMTHRSPVMFDIDYILAILAMILVSPISWQHVFLILVLPFGWLASQAAALPNRYRALVVLALLLCSLPDVQIARRIMRISAPGSAPWYMGLPLLAGTLSVLIIGFLVIKSRPTSSIHKPRNPQGVRQPELRL